MSWFEWLEWVLLLAGFAAIHVTWQTFVAGAVVAVLAGFPERVSPRLRYSVAFVLLLALPVLALGSAALVAASRSSLVAQMGPAGPVSAQAAWIVSAVPWVGLFWALGTALGLTRLIGGAIRTAGLAAP